MTSLVGIEAHPIEPYARKPKAAEGSQEKRQVGIMLLRHGAWYGE